VAHRTVAELEAGLDEIRGAPADDGTVALIVRRPAVEEREILAEGELSLELGLVGDTWNVRSSKRTDGGGPHPDMQVNVINARLSALIADDEQHRALAGDQLHLDLDLSEANLPPGTRLALGTAVIEITAQPHNGCAKFSARFGKEALRFVNSPVGKELHLRGVNAKVVQAGTVHAGDTVTKVPLAALAAPVAPG
jgi:MOSC domain-containing protein YiiM